MAKNPAAVSLGRKGGRATAQKLTVEERIESARNAARVRWALTKIEKRQPKIKKLLKKAKGQ